MIRSKALSDQCLREGGVLIRDHDKSTAKRKKPEFARASATVWLKKVEQV